VNSIYFGTLKAVAVTLNSIYFSISFTSGPNLIITLFDCSKFSSKITIFPPAIPTVEKWKTPNKLSFRMLNIMFPSRPRKLAGP